MEDLTSQNPSYQNYLAKQMLANPKVHGLTTPSDEPDPEKPTTGDIVSTNKLGSLLDTIDSTKASTLSTIPLPKALESTSSPFDWIRQYDVTYGQNYYYNYKTGVSQWEQPEGFVETTTYSSTPVVSLPSSATPAQYAATFNSKTGEFSTIGTGTYWDKMGRSNDREGRQMSGIKLHF
jgi:hypothetical protein